MDAPGIASYLKTNPVYVADGLPPTIGTNISSLLTTGDGIKVAVLPDGQSAKAVADQVLSAQGNTASIIMVASGEDVVAVSNFMPAGDLSDLLARASNVSTNGVDTIRTLVGNVHTWQAAHPTLNTATQQPAGPLDFAVPLGLGGGPVVIALVAALIFFRRRRHLSATVKGTGPRDIRPLVARLMEERNHLRSPAMKRSIESLCEYVEAYFKRVKDDEVAREALRGQLTDAFQVVHTFRRIEESPLYYRDPQKSKSQGVAAIAGLGDSVLESVRSANARALVNYSVSTQILDAQRYR